MNGLLGMFGGGQNPMMGQQPQAPRGMAGGGGLLGSFGGGQGLANPMQYYGGGQGGMQSPFYRPFTPQAPQNAPQRYVPQTASQQPQQAPAFNQQDILNLIGQAFPTMFDPKMFGVSQSE